MTGCGAGATPTARRLGADPKAQLANLEASHGARRRRRSARSPTTSSEASGTAGVDHVGIGSDYFGGASPEGLENVSRFPHLFAELVRRGFSDRDLEKMSSANILRVMRRVEAVSRRLHRTRPPAIGRIEDYPGA